MLRPRVVVAGAAGGIGLEVVGQLTRQGSEVIALVLNQGQAQSARDAGADCAILCDLSAEASVETALEEVGERVAGGGLQALIVCAALQPTNVLELSSRRQLEALYAVNVFGTFQLVQGLIPCLRGGGRLVLFSSLAGRVASPMLGAYCSSKHALEALGDTLRMELHSSAITVSLIEPGGVATTMALSQEQQVVDALAVMNTEQKNRYRGLYASYAKLTSTALKRALPPAKVAAVAVEAALGKARPRARYVIGLEAVVLVNLKKILPSRWLDGVFRRLISPQDPGQ